MNDLEVLIGMKETIEDYGWIQRDMQNDDGVCLLGAYVVSTGSYGTEGIPRVLLVLCAEWLDDQFPTAAPHLDNDVDPIVTAFNDDEHTTVEDVMLTLKKAIEIESGDPNQLALEL